MRRCTRTAVQVCLAAALSAASAAAQTSLFTFNVGGGFTRPVQDLKDRLDTGWNINAGAGVNLDPHFGVIGEFGYNEFGITRNELNRLGQPDGSTRIYSVTLNPIIRFNPNGPVDVYVIGGGGYYRRTVEFTRPTLSTVTVFDPWWGVFFNAPIVANQVLGSFTSNKGGLNIGAGLTVRLGSNTKAKLYAEARYHHMFTRNIDTTYLPVTFGFRW